MFNLHLSYQWLHYTRPSGPPSLVPEGLERHWLTTPSGTLELLSALPPPSVERVSPPVVFCHGGMGCAWVWADYMRFLAAHGVPCYAISLRGHGDSWYPSYLRMVFATPRARLEDDLVAGIEWVQEREGSQVILVGHSSGGGLSQAVLGKGRVDVKALALLGAVPAYGSMGVYINWWRLDPWFTVRMIFHGYHSNSPLSHPVLTHRVFFGDQFPLSSVIPFQRHLNRYESFLWPFSMMYPFAAAADILRHVRNGNENADSVLVLAGSQDKLMTPQVTVETAQFYREGAKKAGDAGVRMQLVEGAGHHLQNDVQWEDGATKLLDFVKTVA